VWGEGVTGKRGGELGGGEWEMVRDGLRVL